MYGLFILLEDCIEDGTTVFLPISRFFFIRIRNLFIYPRISLKLIPKLFKKALTGKAGDIYLINKTIWHGRSVGTKVSSNLTILTSLLSSNRSFSVHKMDKDLELKLGSKLKEIAFFREDETEQKDQSLYFKPKS